MEEPEPTFDILASEYEVDAAEPIGLGNFGSVHFAARRSDQKLVAIKAVSKVRTLDAAKRSSQATWEELLASVATDIHIPYGEGDEESLHAISAELLLGGYGDGYGDGDGSGSGDTPHATGQPWERVAPAGTTVWSGHKVPYVTVHPYEATKASHSSPVGSQTVSSQMDLGGGGAGRGGPRGAPPRAGRHVRRFQRRWHA